MLILSVDYSTAARHTIIDEKNIAMEQHSMELKQQKQKHNRATLQVYPLSFTLLPLLLSFKLLTENIKSTAI